MEIQLVNNCHCNARYYISPVGQEFTVGQHLGQPAGEQVSLRGLTGQVDEGSDRKTGHVNVLVLGLKPEALG